MRVAHAGAHPGPYAAANTIPNTRTNGGSDAPTSAGTDSSANTPGVILDPNTGVCIVILGATTSAGGINHFNEPNGNGCTSTSGPPWKLGYGLHDASLAVLQVALALDIY